MFSLPDVRGETVNEKRARRRVVLYIAVAYLFAMGVRLLLAYTAADTPAFHFEGRIIPLWTEDAGLYGDAAKQLLAGNADFLVKAHTYLLSYVVYGVTLLTGLHVDTVMFYLPAFLAPLIVVPVVLIMALYGLARVGFVAALVAGIGFNFYFRTHLGYTDTDLLNFFFPLMMVYGVIAVSKRQDFRFALVAALSALLLKLWHHSANPVIFGILAFAVLYTVVFDRKNPHNYLGIALIAMVMLPLPMLYRALLIAAAAVAAGLLLKRLPRLFDHRVLLALTGAGVLAVVLLGHPQAYLYRIDNYLNKRSESVFTDASGVQISIQSTLKNIAEAESVTWGHALENMIGSPWLFLLGVAGLLLLNRREKSSILLWVLLLAGLSSKWTGIRFTTYAIPVLAIGLSYAIFAFKAWLGTRAGRRPAVVTMVLLSAALVAFTLMRTLEHNKLLKPVLLSDEVAMLDTLSRQGSPDDFVLTWWDLGWPMWYFAGKRTLIDNGKHDSDNFVVAKGWFSTDQQLTANLSRYFIDRYARCPYTCQVVMQVAKRKDMQALLRDLSERSVPEKRAQRDIYFYFDDSMIDRLPVIAAYATLDGTNPLQNEILSYTYLEQPFAIQERYVHGRGFTFDRGTGLITTPDGQKGQVSRLIVSDGTGVKIQQFYPRADYNLIVYKNRYVLMASDRMLETFVVKALILNQYDPTLFEAVGVSGRGKILKLK